MVPLGSTSLDHTLHLLWTRPTTAIVSFFMSASLGMPCLFEFANSHRCRSPATTRYEIRISFDILRHEHHRADLWTPPLLLHTFWDRKPLSRNQSSLD